MNLTTEYLFIVDKSTSPSLYRFCKSADNFKELLQENTQIVFRQGDLVFDGTHHFSCEINTNGVAGKEQRFFHIVVTFAGENGAIQAYEGALRAIRSAAGQHSIFPETLWDDLARHYSERSYPLIHRAESLMRKLITYFMLTNIGRGWVGETAPDIFKEAMDKSKRKQQSDTLHQADFIQLGDLLFKPYPNRDAHELLAKLKRARALADLDWNELGLYVPRSNWERYFSKLVECQDEFLNKRWKELYDLRCKVAHNALVTRQDHARIEIILSEIEPHLRRAIDNLSAISVPPEEKEQVAENAATTLSAAFGDFFLKWREFEATVSKLSEDTSAEEATPKRPRSARQLLQGLLDDNVIDENFFESSLRLVKFRNHIAHGEEPPPTEQDLQASTVLLESLNRQLETQLRSEPSWSSEITRGLEKLGGEASLSELYGFLEENAERERTTNWHAIVRYTLQKNTPGTQTHARGGGDLFRQVGRGRYALKNKQ